MNFILNASLLLGLFVCFIIILKRIIGIVIMVSNRKEIESEHKKLICVASRFKIKENYFEQV